MLTPTFENPRQPARAGYRYYICLAERLLYPILQQRPTRDGQGFNKHCFCFH